MKIKIESFVLLVLALVSLATTNAELFAQDPLAAEPEAQDQQESLWTRTEGVDWPTFLGGDGESKSSETGILTDWSDGKLKLLWQRETGEGYAMGSVAEGRFYHFGLIDSKATLVCVNAETGKDLWEFSYRSEYEDLYGYDSGPRASPVINDGRVYIYGVEGHLHCLNATTGEPIWDMNINERFGVIQNFFGVASTPVVYEDLIWVMVGGSPEESQDVPAGALDRVVSNGTGLVAFDKATGEIKFQSVDDLASYASLKVATFQDKPILLAFMRGALHGVNPSDGQVAFRFPWRAKKLESVNAAMPMAVEDHVLITECYEVGAALLKIEDLKSELVWSDQGKREVALKSHWCAPVVAEDVVYGCSGEGSGSSKLVCIDWKTGKVNWSERGLRRTSLTMIDGHLIVLGEGGRLMLVKQNKEQFELETEYQPGEDGIRFKSPCWAAPIVSHGLLFVRGKTTVACFDLIPGK